MAALDFNHEMAPPLFNQGVRQINGGNMRTIVLVLMTLLLSGCTMVQSDISVFHDLPSTAQVIKYAILPLKSQEGSLEHKSYEQLVKAELNKHGYIETPVGDAEMVVFLDYGIDTGHEALSSYPIIGQTGTASSYTTGTVQSYGGYATYSGTTYNTPTYGVVGTGTRSGTVYTRFLHLDFVDRSELAAGRVKKRYEAKVVSAGSSSQIAAVMPAMIKALFKDFPGKSGSTRRVDVPMQQ